MFKSKCDRHLRTSARRNRAQKIVETPDVCPPAHADPVSTDHDDGLTGEWQNPVIFIATSHDLMTPIYDPAIVVQAPESVTEIVSTGSTADCEIGEPTASSSSFTEEWKDSGTCKYCKMVMLYDGTLSTIYKFVAL